MVWGAGGRGGTNRAATCVTLCTNNFKNSPVYQRQDVSMKREYLRLLRNANFKLNYANTRICILLVFLEVKSPQAHFPPSALQFYVFSFISTFRFFFLSLSYATHFCHHGYRSIWLANQERRCNGKLSQSFRGSAAKLQHSPANLSSYAGYQRWNAFSHKFRHTGPVVATFIRVMPLGLPVSNFLLLLFVCLSVGFLQKNSSGQIPRLKRVAANQSTDSYVNSLWSCWNAQLLSTYLHDAPFRGLNIHCWQVLKRKEVISVKWLEENVLLNPTETVESSNW